MSESRLPPGFEELERYMDWSLPSIGERRRKRLSSTMEEIDDFYQAILPRMKEIANYLNEYPLQSLNEQQRNLHNLAFSFMAVAPAVEIFRQPEVKGNTFPYSRFVECDPITGVALSPAV